MRLLLDTNVLVSAVVAAGVSRRLFELWRRDRRFELVVCPTLLAELEAVLTRDRFARFITPAEVSELVGFLRTEADFVDDPADVPASTRDPDDDYLVAVAQRERVYALVSGDSDLQTRRCPHRGPVACRDLRAPRVRHRPQFVVGEVCWVPDASVIEIRSNPYTQLYAPSRIATGSADAAWYATTEVSRPRLSYA